MLGGGTVCFFLEFFFFFFLVRIFFREMKYFKASTRFWRASLERRQLCWAPGAGPSRVFGQFLLILDRSANFAGLQRPAALHSPIFHLNTLLEV